MHLKHQLFLAYSKSLKVKEISQYTYKSQKSALSVLNDELEETLEVKFWRVETRVTFLTLPT